MCSHSVTKFITNNTSLILDDNYILIKLVLSVEDISTQPYKKSITKQIIDKRTLYLLNTEEIALEEIDQLIDKFFGDNNKIVQLCDKQGNISHYDATNNIFVE